MRTIYKCAILEAVGRFTLDLPAGAELAITDVSMPGELDGIALATPVSERLAGVSIVLMSGDSASLARGGRAPGVTTNAGQAIQPGRTGRGYWTGHAKRVPIAAPQASS
jgi:hypothetical protein